MSAQLAKLHVRFIQSQTHFHLIKDQGEKQEKLPISQLYVKDNNSFYLLSLNPFLENQETFMICFDETTPALKRLECTVTKEEVPQGSEDYDDALLFFNVDTSKNRQIFLLHINTVDDA